MSFNHQKSQLDDSLYFQEKRQADNKQAELDKINNEIEEYRNSATSLRKIPDHVWRPSWTTANLVAMVNIMYNQKKILSKTIDKICNKWPEKQEFVYNVINDETVNINYDKNLNTLLSPYQNSTFDYPKTPDIKEWVKKDELMTFPFKDRVNERKRERGIK